MNSEYYKTRRKEFGFTLNGDVYHNIKRVPSSDWEYVQCDICGATYGGHYGEEIKAFCLPDQYTQECFKMLEDLLKKIKFGLIEEILK